MYILFYTKNIYLRFVINNYTPFSQHKGFFVQAKQGGNYLDFSSITRQVVYYYYFFIHASVINLEADYPGRNPFTSE